MDPNRRWADIPTSRQQAFIPETPRVTDSYWRRDMLADQPTSAYPTVVPGARTLRNPRSGVDVPAPKKGAKRRPRVVLLTSLLIAMAVIGISSLGGWGYLTFVAHRSPFSKPPTPAISHTQPTQTPVPPDEQSQAKAFGKKYMNAFLQQHYDVMWSSHRNGAIPYAERPMIALDNQHSLHYLHLQRYGTKKIAREIIALLIYAHQ